MNRLFMRKGEIFGQILALEFIAILQFACSLLMISTGFVLPFFHFDATCIWCCETNILHGCHTKFVLSVLQNYWWAIVLCCGIAMGLFIVAMKFLAICTKNSNLFLEDKQPKILCRRSSIRMRKTISDFGENLRGSSCTQNQQLSWELDSRGINEITGVELSLLNENPN